MFFPKYRLRRLRENEKFRNMVRETSISINKLIFPLFVVPGKKVKKEISSMPGNYHFSIDYLIEEVKEIQDIGIPAVLLFGIPEAKDAVGSGAYDSLGIVQKAVQAIKKTCPDMIVITDVCLCEYTNHGHCGLIQGENILNDPSLKLIAKVACSHAKAGADMVAPSDMMDGRVEAIRNILDKSGFSHIPIMSYAAKYASSFYGPFREAAYSTPQFGDRRSYQMDPSNAREALREVELDIEEGADIIMVKPALAYLDIINRVKETFNYPVAAYNVSGEYSMVKAAHSSGWIDEKKVTMEIITAIFRAGADIIITYHAKELAKWMR
ncbi:MAG: porphobilinogen synthase [Candidatus Firestonebacteria bacterium]|nr:porphobilinogen synthase [Candidatus Firestonebacteria bacterium]